MRILIRRTFFNTTIIIGLLSIVLVAEACKHEKKDGVVSGKAADTTDQTKDLGWPREIIKDGDTLTYYQPQVDDWKDFKILSARVAFSLKPKGEKEALGVASISAETMVDKENHTVYLKKIGADDVRFPALDDTRSAKMTGLFKELVPKSGDPISVDRVMADLEKGKIQTKAVAVKNDPPPIFYSQKPAILLIVEGNPVLAPIEKNSMQYVVNTNWDLFFEKTSKSYYLLVDHMWLTSKDLKGNWTLTTKLPADMDKLPSGENFDEVKKMIPPKVGGVAPNIFFSSSPAELILVEGDPKFVKIPNTQLMYIDNTDNDVFASEQNGLYYVLLSGRWFSSKSLTGPWVYAGNSLPADFTKIPEDSPRGNVLASVPGTQQASDAVMLAQIPTTAVVNKAEVEKKVKVNYDGTPVFKPISGTSLQYATNTQEKVIKVGDLYYLCFQGVWFMSTTATGPWKTADSVPKEIYTIPPSSPVYNVTYVTQTNATPTTVESSTTGGYLGVFVIGMALGACLTYGTGYYYPPYVYWGPYPYPVYRPWPCTYGAGVVYNPWTGGYVAGRRVYGPYGAAGTSAWYNPVTGRYGRSASVQGWYGGRTVAQAYNPWTGGYAATSQGHNAYAQWGSSVATRGGQWVQTGHVTTRYGTTTGYRTSSGQSGVVTHGINGGTSVRTNNGIYAGKDGNVYRKDNNGNWQHYNNKDGGWTQAGTLGSTQHKPATAGTNQQRPAQTADADRQRNLAGKTEQHPSIPERTGSNPIGGTGGVQREPENRGFQNPTNEHTFQNLDHSVSARERGQMQTERFQRQGRAGGFRRH
ncbi:hypothetical protein D3C80_525800 [compost metagenome]